MTYSEKLRDLRETAQILQEDYRLVMDRLSASVKRGRPMTSNEVSIKYHKFNAFQRAFSNYTDFLMMVSSKKIPLRSEFIPL